MLCIQVVCVLDSLLVLTGSRYAGDKWDLKEMK